MAIRKIKNGGRRKAGFGTDSAAILGAAAMNVAGTLAAAGISANASKQAAQDQARATLQFAQRQSQALKEQNERSKELQLESQEFVKEQNTENRELQKDIQLQLQMLTGQQNVNDRLEASKIQVKNGGSTKRKLRTAGYPSTSLRGSNMPFVVTDGGGVIPIGTTPEGYDLYEITGNDHEHYHKAQGGKNKTGVGIKFADGNVVEGEGNQNGNQGEYMLNTPETAYFISRHSVAGFNPAKMIKRGMHPLQAYMIQENLKAMNGISDDGKHNSSPVRKLMGGDITNFYNMINANGPQTGVDTIGDTVVGVASQFAKPKRVLKCGGRVKAKNGWHWDYNTNSLTYGDYEGNGRYNYHASPQSSNSGASTSKGGFSNWLNNNAQLVGAGLGALGNIGGAWITSAANRSAARTIADAQNQAAGIMADAYRSLTGIDMNNIRREDFAAAHAMPALQAPVSFAAGQNALVNRALQRNLANAGRYSASSAAAQRRMANAEIAAQDARNQVYSADQRQMQEIRQANAERVTQAAMKNAELDTAANRDYTAVYLDLLQYNNDINNQKILGAAGVTADAINQSANTMAAARNAGASAWANALVGSTQGFTNSINAIYDRRAKLEQALLGAYPDSRASYYARLANEREARAEYDSLVAQWNAANDADTKNRLARQINNIASRRGYQMV